MSKLLKFNPLCGENVQICKNQTTAEWNLQSSSGRMYIKDPLSPGRTVRLLFQGSGHCNVGYVTEDPNIYSTPPSIPLPTSSATSSATSPCLKVTDLKSLQFHKQDSILEMSLDKNNKELVTLFGLGKQETKQERHKLSYRKPIWISLEIRHGMMVVKLDQQGSPEQRYQFSNHHGTNIKLEDNSTLAKSLIVCPATTCFLDKRLNIGDMVQFQCSPVHEQGRPAHRFSLKIQVFENNPEHLKKECKYLFNASEAQTDSPLTMVQELDRKECNGTISLCLMSPTLIECRTATNTYFRHEIEPKSTDGIWIVLEMFRVAVTITQCTPKLMVNNNTVDNACVISQCRQRKTDNGNVLAKTNNLKLSPSDSNNFNAINDTIAQCKSKARERNLSDAKHNATNQGNDTVDGVIPIPVNELALNTGSFSFSEETCLKRVVNTVDNSSCGFENLKPRPCQGRTSQIHENSGLIQERTSQIKGVNGLGQERFVLEGRLANLEKGFHELHSMLQVGNHSTARKLINNDSLVRRINFRSNFTSLVRDIDCMPLLDKLFEQNMITQVDYDGTAQQNTSIDRNRALLRLLDQKNITKITMDHILDSIEQGHLKDKF